MDREVRVELVIRGRVNERTFECAGLSKGRFGSGSISAEVSTAELLPKGFDIGLLTSFMLTGQPSMSRATEGAHNPFIATGGIYKGRRSLDLGPKGSLTAEYTVDRDGSDLRAVFDVSGRSEVPPLVDIEPTIETWTPNGPGRIGGQFTMVWRTAAGTRVIGKTDTEYALPSQEALKGVQFREIRIDFKSTPQSLSQSERIVLFTPALLTKVLG
jgi:hypothetical protein